MSTIVDKFVCHFVILTVILLANFKDITSQTPFISTNSAEGILTALKVQTIIFSNYPRKIRYEAVETVKGKQKWCFNQVPVQLNDNFMLEMNQTGLNYTDPMPSHVEEGHLLYLNENENMGCIIGTLHPISSNVGNISSASAIWIDVIPAIPCPQPPLIQNGYRVITTTEQDDTGERHNATYSCDTGYSLIGSDTIQCVRKIDEQVGLWPNTEDLPTCTPITCEILPQNLSNGSATYGTNITNGTVEYGSEIIYECDPGFDLVGDRKRTCSSDVNNTGYWTGSPPYCQQQLPAQCPYLEAPLNGTSMQSTNAMGQTFVTYNCESGYMLEGNERRMCSLTSDGRAQWSGTSVRCVIMINQPVFTDAQIKQMQGTNIGVSVAVVVVLSVVFIVLSCIFVLKWRQQKRRNDELKSDILLGNRANTRQNVETDRNASESVEGGAVVANSHTSQSSSPQEQKTRAKKLRNHLNCSDENLPQGIHDDLTV